VLNCFKLLFRRLGKDIWNGESPAFPVEVFEVLRQNPRFREFLCSTDSSVWFKEFLSLVRGHAAFGDVFRRVIDFLFEEMPDEPTLMRCGLNVRGALHPNHYVAILKSLFLQLLLDLQQGKAGSIHPQVRPEFDLVLDNHACDIVAIAYSHEYMDDEWKGHRERARHWLLEGLSIDIETVAKSIRNICRHFGEVKAGKSPTTLRPFSIKTRFWQAFYSTIDKTRDSNAIADLILMAAKAAHVDQLKPDVFKDCKVPEFFNFLDDVNNGLGIIQGGVLSTISNFAGQCVSTNGLDVLRTRGAGEAVTLLLLSPVSDLHLAGVTLVGFSFDVDGRLESLRALLENLPDQALDGIFYFLRTFLEFTTFLVEACSLSTTLVRCFADILDVLCSSQDGLLHNTPFLRSEDSNGPAARLPLFWNLLTRSLSRIYNRCPIWAEFIETPDMIIWMRDALILARDVIKKWRVLETASNSYVKAPSQPSLARTSPVGQRMVESLQEFLGELARWLRLTDEELLHQSFSLLQSLLDILKATNMKPSDAALRKLMKYVEQIKAGKNAQPRGSRLDTGRLLQLSKALAFFESDDIVEVKTTPRPTTQVSHSVAKEERPVMSTSLEYNTAKSPTDPAFLERTHDASSTLEPDESDSSNSDSEENSVPSTGLASLGKFVKSPRSQVSAKSRVVERRQVRVLPLPSVANALQERVVRNQQMRNAALRLRPDISGLHKVILSWDYNHNGPIPLENKSIRQVADKFSSYQHYFQVFQPLLLAECWAQLSQAKEEVQDSYQCRVDSRQYADDWLEIDLTIIESVKKGWYLAETDIVLLHHPSDRTKCLMAKVKTYKAFPSGVQVLVRCYLRPGSRELGPQLTTAWQISKLFRCASTLSFTL
jgi:senataxin